MQTSGPWFKDAEGRTLMLRGVNLSGSSKVPVRPNGATYNPEGFFEYRDVSFVGRPFPLSAADEHFRRLKTWGLDFVRFLVTWEAVEHAGPGQYDEAYLDYLHAVIAKADEYGIRVFIDPHQDVWSRFTGGDGAPGWTLEAAGFDIRHLYETGASIVHQIHGDPFPRMVWPSNSTKLATATMMALFFAGNDFAPLLKVDGQPIQDYLQSHYLAAMQKVAERLKDLPNVVGYDTFNEPIPGYIGWPDLNRRHGVLQTGLSPTPYQSMLLGAGLPQYVDLLERGILAINNLGKSVVNPGRVRVWREGADCIWRMHGVWDFDDQGIPRLLKPHYFQTVNGRRMDFNQDYVKPFIERYIQAIRAVVPDTLIFVEGEAFAQPPCWPQPAPGLVYAPHWYDGYVLFFKAFNPWIGSDSRGGAKPVFGPLSIRRSFAGQILEFKKQARACLGNAPVVVGEFGISFDMHLKAAYRTGNFHQQERALQRSIRAMEDALASYTIWNYTPDNTNARGDLWNDEDLSIFSPDQQSNPADIHSGGRALRALLRPYPRCTAGEPLQLSYDYRTRRMQYQFRHAAQVEAPTEFYVPAFIYPQGCRVQVSDGEFELDLTRQRLIYRHSSARGDHQVVITPLDAPQAG
jgi:hypothetical protein